MHAANRRALAWIGITLMGITIAFLAFGERRVPPSESDTETSPMVRPAEAAVTDVRDESPLRTVVVSDPRLAASPSTSTALTVRLRGLHPDAPFTTPIALFWEGLEVDQWQKHEAVARPSADTATLQLPTWITTTTQQKARLELRDPNYHRIELRRDGGFDPTKELVVDVQVIARILGRVLDVRGAPVPATRVCAFAMLSGQPIDTLLARCNTRDDGSFTLQAPPAVALFLVALPMEPYSMSGKRFTGEDGVSFDRGELRTDLLPASARTTGEIDSGTRIPDLVLPDAARIEGLVRWGNGTPVATARVDALPQDGITLGVDPLVAVQVLPSGAIAPLAFATTGHDGAFVLPGLAGANTTLAVRHVEGTPPIGDRRQTTVVPPQRLELVVGDRLDVCVVHSGEPAPNALLEIEAPIGTITQVSTPRSGRLLLPVAAQNLRLRASRNALRSPWVEVDTRVQREVVLELGETLCEVRIEFDGSDSVRNAQFTWTRADGRVGSARKVRDDREGAFAVHLEEGHYRFRAAHAAGERNGTFLLPVERTIEVGREPVNLTLPAVFGGRLRIVATDARGLHAAGSCRVFGDDGIERTGRFAVDDRGARRTGTHAEILAGGPNEFEDLLPGGEYRLEFDFGRRGALQRTVTVEPFEVAEVVVRLP